MIQIGTIRDKKGFNFIAGFNYPTIRELFNRVEKDLDKFIAQNEQFNLYFTVAHHLQGKRKADSFKQQNVIAFDIDGVDTSRLDDYLAPIEKALAVPLDKCGVVYSGNGIHIYVGLKEPISDRDYFKKAKEGYGIFVEAINGELKLAGLSGSTDRTAWDSSRVLRVPFTKNIKFKDGKESVKEVVLKNSNLVPLDFKLQIIEKEKKTDSAFYMKGGTFPSPDIETISKQCEFIKLCTEEPSKVHEPDMYAFFSILGHSNEGRRYALDFAHKNFSSPSIDACDKEAKMHQAVTITGPRTCVGIADLKGAALCQKCKHYNQLTSPIQIKGDDFIGSADTGFTLKGPRGANIRQYQDLLNYYDKKNSHVSIGAIKKVYTYTGTHYRLTNDTELKNFAHERFLPLATTEEANEFCNLVKRSNYLDEDFLESNTDGFINLDNGVLNINNGELLAHDKKYNFLYCLPYNYNPEARAPKFEKFLDDVTLGRQCLKNVLLEYMGYILSGSPYIYQKCLILDGAGKNGKTTLLKVIKALVGRENIANISIESLIGNVFSSSGLHGKLVNISEEEPPKSFREQNGVFKNLTGDGTINAQYKYGNAFEFDNRSKLVITYNEMPYLADTTKGMLRRLMIVPFDYDLENEHKDKVNPNIDKDLAKELEGIFILALEGYKRLCEQKGFTKSVYIDSKIEAIHAYSDIVYSFLKETCTVTRDPSNKVARDKLYSMYEEYHKDNASTERLLTKKGFTRRLAKYGVNLEVSQKMINGNRNIVKRYVGVNPIYEIKTKF